MNDITVAGFFTCLLSTIPDFKGKVEYCQFNPTDKSLEGFGNIEMKHRLRRWKENNIKCFRSNFREFKIKGTEYYYFAVNNQDTINKCIFTHFLCLKEHHVIGYGFLCRHKENREMIWKYLGSN